MSGQVFLLWGEDDFGIAERLKELEDSYGNPGERLFNVSRLDGRSISLEELKGVLYSLPLFASRRLVILSQVVGRIQNPNSRKQLLEIIAGVPDSTVLVIVEPQKLAADHWLINWLKNNRDAESTMFFSLKKGPDMEKWIQEQVHRAGGKMTPRAANTLSGLVIDDSRLAYQEIIKLLTYVNNARPIDVEDVEAICTSIGQGNVFAMVDALVNSDGRVASAFMHRLLEERDALSLFQMIVRQFRMILVARELMDSGGNVTYFQNQLHIQDWVAKKVWTQARRFSMSTVEAVYHQLLEMDKQIKMGEIEDSLALETFVSRLTSLKE